MIVAWSSKKQKQKQIVCIVNAHTAQEEIVTFDSRILNFNVTLLNLDVDEPYQIPTTVAATSSPLQFMKEFVTKHNYNPLNIRILKPLTFVNIKEVFDFQTYLLVEIEFTNSDHFNQGLEIVKLAHFLQFSKLEEAVEIALTANFWPSQSHDPNKMKEQMKQQEINEDKAAELFDVLLEYQSTIMMGESIEKQDIFNKYLRKFCLNDYDFRTFAPV